MTTDSMSVRMDGLFSKVDRFSGRLGPISAAIDTIVDKITPKAVAMAGCPPRGCVVCRKYSSPSVSQHCPPGRTGQVVYYGCYGGACRRGYESGRCTRCVL